MKQTIVILYSILILGCISNKKMQYANEIIAIKNIKEMPYYPELSGDTIFWNLTKGKKYILPELIKHIDDTTSTLAPVLFFGGDYTVGDVCIEAIGEIVTDFDVLKLIEIDQADYEKKGYGVYWDFINANDTNRIILKQKVAKWFKLNKNKLVWVEDYRLYGVTDDESRPAQRRPAGGYYIVKR